MYQYGVAAYVTKTSPQAGGLQVLSFKEYGIGYNAKPFLKSKKAVRDATQIAITELKADGAYGKILEVWGMEANSLEKITVNDGLKYNQPSN
jgi:polar amino acid transport system substrate-binding protein